MKEILFIAALPPPYTGLAIISQRLLEIISRKREVVVVDFSKKTYMQGMSSVSRIFEILFHILMLATLRKGIKTAYLTLSQSVFGNIKDLCFLFLLRKTRCIVHLHGGGLRNIVFDRHPMLRLLNKIAYRNVVRIIVLGESHKKIFSNIANENKICYLPNFAEEYFFLDDAKITAKWNDSQIAFLFLSNLLPGKGYRELVDASIALVEEGISNFSVDFCGDFQSLADKREFLKLVEPISQIKYHGVLKGVDRVALTEKAQVLCLPTYYPFSEGQPVSILEAYAAGCLVLTTNIGGIPDIFSDGRNGFFVETQSVIDLKMKMKVIINDTNKEKYLTIGIENAKEARQKYTSANFERDSLNIILN